MPVEELRIHSADDFSLTALSALKATTTVSVCLPARNEADTIGAIVDSIRTHFATHTHGDNNLVDEIIVMDDRSTDTTAEVATAAGATVISVADVLPGVGRGSGKGTVLWKSVAASTGDIIVWVDADLTSFTPSYILGLLGPMLADPEVAMVKGFYERPEQGGAAGGRTTELMARPLLSTFFAELTVIQQPLGGEYAVRREFLEQVPFCQGYGVETGLLIDIARLVGVNRIAQVDLGVRSHRTRPLKALSAQSMEVLHATLHRLGVEWRPEWSSVLQRPGSAPTEVQVAEHPPLNTVPDCCFT
ncbi:MAG: glucosyl-3-phosphoglycerate synthase [Acidimicrobiaceae bacterium]|jgi:glucosyl-3-phosphoglycerate synthase|nr:glucosyl-3-phosphoglycerate synthase [Acidimicrobiaceae bacterium]MBT5851050.1 glucosyl-3-phosphoglycerate synthase [Acidimicrobiaceae bacterium]